MSAVIKNAVYEAYKGFFVADAVSMPVHWYYEASKIKEDYNGWITQYEKPNNSHPMPFPLTLPEPVSFETNDGIKKVQVIGDVILKDKFSAYQTNDLKANHFHMGMNAGDITLNCHCALLMMKILREHGSSVSNGDEIVKQFFSDYVTFMTTPGTHNDTYAELFHRSFFGDWVGAGSPTDKDELYKFTTERLKRLSNNITKDHQPYIGSFIIPTPLILETIDRPVKEVIEIAAKIYKRTHPNKDLIPSMNSYIRVLHSVVRGASLKEEAEKAFIQHFGEDGKSILDKYDKLVKESSDKLLEFQKMGEELGLKCSVVGSFPILMFIARYYHDDFEGGILCNANVGGDNNGRAPPLGALLGAAAKAKNRSIPSKWTDQLRIKSILDQLLSE